MKKVSFFVLVLLITICFSSINVHALTEQEIVNRISDTEVKTLETVELVNEWSNNYGLSLKDLMTRDNIRDFKNLNYEQSINLLITKLRSYNYIEAANDLETKKSIIINNLAYAQETVDTIEAYLNDNIDGADLGIMGPNVDDIFYQIKNSLTNIKQPVKNLAKLYYDMYYEYINEKIDSYNSISDLRSLYNEILDYYDNSLTNIRNRITRYKGLYDAYHMEDNVDLIKSYFGEDYQTFKTYYQKLYTKLENKGYELLNAKIDVIVADTDESNVDSIINRNNKLYEIIDYIKEVKEDVLSRFDSEVSGFESYNLFSYIAEYRDQINKSFDDSITYTESYLLETKVLDLKNESDKSNTSIDESHGIIIYNNSDLDLNNFKNKFTTPYDSIEIENSYNNKIGTRSVLNVFNVGNIIKKFTVIVKGDINPSGRVDITDVVTLCKKMFNGSILDTYQLIAADMNNDSRYDITDIVMICRLFFR